MHNKDLYKWHELERMIGPQRLSPMEEPTLVKGNSLDYLKRANDKQVNGDHYKKYGDLQPWDVVLKWKLGYLEGTALKYIARWRDKGGLTDIKKAIHFLEKLVEEEEKNGLFKST